MDSATINVTKEEQKATYTQVVTPGNQEDVLGVITALHEMFKRDRFKGKLTVNYNQGGVTNIVTEQVTHIRKGSEADRILDGEFGK